MGKQSKKKAEKVNDPSNVKIRRHVVKNDKIVAASVSVASWEGSSKALHKNLCKANFEKRNGSFIYLFLAHKC